MEMTDIDLRGLPVVTITGENVGKIAGISFDTASHAIRHYIVARSRLLAPLLPKELFIAPSQVISIDDEKMVVQGEVLVEEKAAAVVHEVASGIAAAARE